ncbi:unnamed protein product, partial [Brachionus calyciflorus]
AYDPWVSYGQSKTANILFSVGLTKLYSSQGIFSNAVHPGGIITDLQRHMSHEDKLRLGLIDNDGNVNPRFKSVEKSNCHRIEEHKIENRLFNYSKYLIADKLTKKNSEC